ncbi:MAG: DUF2779 domain-containing protein [bacterium]
MNSYKHKISKSRFVSGVQCEKKLYFDLFRSDLKPAVTAQQQELFDKGHLVGSLAQHFFPNGKDASPESYYDFSESIEHTAQWINEGTKTIYEAAFYFDEVFAALDILHHHNGERLAIEVKSSTAVKDYHLQDASLQYWVMSRSGFKPDKFFLMYIDNTYVKHGEIDPKALFKMTDITDAVIINQAWVERKLSQFKLLSADNEPAVEISKDCRKPFICDYIAHCWQHLSENSVFTLNSPHGKDWKLYNQGIMELAEIPVEFQLSHRQLKQVEGVKNGSSYVDLPSIKDFLQDWSYPLYFFDFETIFPAIPVLDGTSPFQQVPFQYSLHIVSEADAKMTHSEFLAIPRHFSNPTGNEDPRKSLIEQLKKDFGSEGSIVAYNASFEKGVLKNLAIAFPEDAAFLENLISRFVDLLVVFRNAWYYKPEMGRSASIKYVLPAIAPDFSYKDLEIGNGGDASNTFLSMIDGTFTGNESETRDNLLRYCERDTEGMVVIWKELVRCLKE